MIVSLPSLEEQKEKTLKGEKRVTCPVSSTREEREKGRCVCLGECAQTFYLTALRKEKSTGRENESGFLCP